MRACAPLRLASTRGSEQSRPREAIQKEIAALLSEVAKDSVPFATILLTVIVGFGTAFNMLGIFDGLASPARGNTLASSVYGTFMFALGELFLDDNLFSSDFHKVLQSL